MSLEAYYRINAKLGEIYGYDAVLNMEPYERDIFIALLQEENARQENKLS